MTYVHLTAKQKCFQLSIKLSIDLFMVSNTQGQTVTRLDIDTLIDYVSDSYALTAGVCGG